MEFDYIENKVLGFIDYGNEWGGAIGEDQNCLRWLAENEAFSFESSDFSINTYIKKIKEVCHLKEEGARKRFYTHKKHGWVESKQNGKMIVEFGLHSNRK